MSRHRLELRNMRSFNRNLMIVFTLSAFARFSLAGNEASNVSHVAAGPYGRCYAKSVPDLSVPNIHAASEDRRGEGRGRPGIPQRRRAPLLVRDDRLARLDPRTGVFATDGSNPDTTT